MLGWMVFPLILANQAAIQEDERQRSMSQVAMLQALEGDWSIDLILVDGKKYSGGTSVAGMRFREETMTFLDANHREKERPFIVDRVDAEHGRIDMKRKQGTADQWYSLKLKDSEVWLFRDGKQSWKLPESVTPNHSNVCLQLSPPID